MDFRRTRRIRSIRRRKSETGRSSGCTPDQAIPLFGEKKSTHQSCITPHEHRFASCV